MTDYIYTPVFNDTPSNMSNNRFQDTNPSPSVETSNHEHGLQISDPEDSLGCYDLHEREELPLQRMTNATTSQSLSIPIPTQTCEYTHQERRYFNEQGNEMREHILEEHEEHETLVPQYRLSLQSSQASTKSGTTHSAAPVCPPANSQARTRELSSPRYWAWEISASILSITCMASVVGVLFYEQDKPLNKWGLGQAYLSPNVVVSFLGTLGKSACLVAIAEIVSQLKWLHFHNRPQELNDLQLFDAASRGPWGALQLAFRKNRSAFLATCASIVILSSLLIDPFIQSVFQFPSILTPIDGAYPTILSSRIYDPSSLDYRNDQCYGPAMVSAPMQAAILAPIWNATRNPSLPCKFERCEWPTITTLGVCSECIDLTETVVSTCTVNGPLVRHKAIDCNYTLPRSINTFNVVFGASGGVGEIRPYSTVWNSALEYPPMDLMETAYSRMTYGFVSSQPAQIVNFTFIQFDPVDYTDSPFNLTSPEPLKKAMQCTMNFCARTFETPSYANFTVSPLVGKSVGLVTSAEGTTTGRQDKVLLGLGPENKTTASTNTSFQVNYCDYLDLNRYLEDLFTAEMDSLGIMESTTDASTTNAECTARSTPNTGLALSQVDDIPALLQQIADSMTEQIRVSANSTTTNGVAMQSEVFIAIKWAWLVLPISVTVLTFFLLIYVIVLNKARGMPLWRSSSLALLFHQVDGWEGTETVLGGPEDMKARAKEMKARVTYEDGMLYFSKES